MNGNGGLQFGQRSGESASAGTDAEGNKAPDNADNQAGDSRESDLNPLANKPADTATEPTLGKVDVEGIKAGDVPVGEENLAGAGAEDSATYVSHPIMRFNLGRFDFYNGRLDLKGDNIAEFEELLDSQPPAIRNKVRKLDAGQGNRFVDLALGRRVRGVDTAPTRPA